MGAGASARTANKAEPSKQSSKPVSPDSSVSPKGKLTADRKKSAGVRLPRLDNGKSLKSSGSDASLEAYSTRSGLSSESSRRALPSLCSRSLPLPSLSSERTSRDIPFERKNSRTATQDSALLSAKNSTSALVEDLRRLQVSKTSTKQGVRRRTSSSGICDDLRYESSRTLDSNSTRKSSKPNLRPIQNERSLRNSRSGSVSWDVSAFTSGANDLDDKLCFELAWAGQLSKAASTPQIKYYSC